MIQVESVTDLKWDGPEHISFTANVKYSTADRVHPATIIDDPRYEHIKYIWDHALAGDYGPIQEFEEQAPIDVPKTLEELLKTL